MNEESKQTTFKNRIGSSNIDLIVVNNQLLTVLKNWEINAEESCSDHNIRKFDLRQDNYHKSDYSYTRCRYIVTDRNLKKFNSNLSQIVAMKFHME